ncbi:hypothetical protein Tco_0169121 [Tanacetum coccineum]
MDDPNITMVEYIRLEEEKARRRGKVYNWETTTYGKIWYDEDVHDLRSVETEFLAIVFNDSLTSEVTLTYEPTVSPLNDNKIDFRILFDESDDEDYTVIYEKNSFSYKIISVNDLKTDSENDNDKVNMPSFPSPEPTVNYFDVLEFLKDFENEFPAIVYNDALMSKSDSSTGPVEIPQRIDEFDLKDETSLSEYDGEKQNILYFNDLFPFKISQFDGMTGIVHSYEQSSIRYGLRRRMTWRQFILALGLHTEEEMQRQVLEHIGPGMSSVILDKGILGIIGCSISSEQDSLDPPPLDVLFETLQEPERHADGERVGLAVRGLLQLASGSSFWVSRDHGLRVVGGPYCKEIDDVVSLGCSGNTTRIMSRTLMINLVFTLCEEQAIWIRVLMRLIDDLSAVDLIVQFGFSDRRLERTATCSILETDIQQKDKKQSQKRQNRARNGKA